MLRVSFSSMTTARAAVNVLEAYGYSAKQFGRDVVTEKRVGFAEIERLELSGRMDSIEPTDAFPDAPSPSRTEASRELMA